MRTDQLSNETSLLNANQPENQSDFFTKLAFAGEYLGVFSDAYWFANVLDLLVGNGEDALGLSYYGIVFGSILAITSAYGASSCQKVLNTHLKNLSQAENTRDDYCSINIPQTEQKKEATLSKKEKALLIASTAAHAADVASGPMFVVKLASKNLLSKDILFTINILALVIGALCSIANTRSCYFAMLALKKMPELKNATVEPAQPDKATIDNQESEKLYTPRKYPSLLSERDSDERHDAANIGSINDSTEQNVVPDKAVDKTQNGWGSYIFSMFPARLQSMVISKKEEPSVIPDDYMVV